MTQFRDNDPRGSRGSRVVTARPRTRYNAPLYSCLLLNDGRVDQESCVRLSSDAESNRDYCTKGQCKCPWRRCLACAVLKVEKPQPVTDYLSGFCAGHKVTGPKIIFDYSRGIVPTAVSTPAVSPVPRVAPEVTNGHAANGVSPVSGNGHKTEVAPPPAAPSIPVSAAGIEKTGEGYYLIPRYLIHPDPKQPRKYFDPTAHRQLVLTMKVVGQLQPVTVRPHPDIPGHFVLQAGERRWQAAEVVGIGKLKAVFTEAADPKVNRRNAAIDNFCRQPHTHLEIMHAILQTQEDFPDWRTIDIAHAFGFESGTWVEQHLSLQKLSPKVWELMNPNRPKKKRLRYSVALGLTSFTHQFQQELASEVLGKSTGPALAHIRKRAIEVGLQVGSAKTKRIPADEYRLIQSYLGRIRNGYGNVQVAMKVGLNRIFKDRSLTEVDETLREIGRSIRELTEFRKAVEDVRRKMK